MISRREVVTAGVLGSLAANTPADAAPAESAQSQQQDNQGLYKRLDELNEKLGDLQRSIDQGLRGSSMEYGLVGAVKATIEKYSRTSGRFPDYCEIGSSVFYDIYDWHVRQQQQISITRVSEQRLAIQFMFTQLILRWESPANYVGTPFDR